MPNSVFLPDEAATVAFGHGLADACSGRGVLTLSGNLGSGKTTLSRGIIQAYGHHGAVKSPTYTLVEPYEIGAIRLYHFDLYRLEDPEELEFLGIWDYLTEEALCIFEWPEKAGELLPPGDLAISLTTKDKGREVSWHSNTEYGKKISDKLASFVQAQFHSLLSQGL